LFEGTLGIILSTRWSTQCFWVSSAWIVSVLATQVNVFVVVSITVTITITVINVKTLVVVVVVVRVKILSFLDSCAVICYQIVF